MVLGIIIIFMAGIVSGLAGFGFALVAVPPLLFIYEPATVTAIVILLLMLTRWVVLMQSWREIEWHPVAAILPTAVIGTAAGAILLRDLDDAYIKLLASLVIIGAAAMMMTGATIPGIQSPLAAPVTGLVAGTLNSAVAIAGPPLVIFSAARGHAPIVFRGTFTFISYFMGFLSIYFLNRQGLIERSDVRLALIFLPAAVLSTWIGQELFRRVPDVHFQRIVLCLLLATGGVGAVTSALDVLG